MIVTNVPAIPELTDIPDTLGADATVKNAPALGVELLVTTTEPLVAVEGTVTVTNEELQLVMAADTPLKVTLPAEPKFAPLIVTDAPRGPDEGESCAILGSVLKETGLLAATDVLTTICTGPGGALLGT